MKKIACSLILTILSGSLFSMEGQWLKDGKRERDERDEERGSSPKRLQIKYFTGNTKSQEELDEELFDAVVNNDIARVKEAIENGANINASDREENTPLHHAAKLIEHLESRESLAKENANGYTPLMLALLHNHENIVVYFKETCQCRLEDSDLMVLLTAAVDRVDETLFFIIKTVMEKRQLLHGGRNQIIKEAVDEQQQRLRVALNMPGAVNANTTETDGYASRSSDLINYLENNDTDK